MSCRKPMWASESEIFTLEFYRDHEELWNTKHKDYYDREMRNQVLQQMSNKLGHDHNGIPYSVRDIKEKLKNMRATFGRELQKIREAKKSNGDKKPYVTRWRHFNRMLFLATSRRTRNFNKYDLTKEGSTLENGSHLDMFCDIVIEEGDHDDAATAISDNDMAPVTEVRLPSSSSTGKKSMLTETLALSAEALEPNLEEKITMANKVVKNSYEPFSHNTKKKSRKATTALSTSSEEVPVGNSHSGTHDDAEYHFCMSMAENLRKLNPFQRESAKIELQKVLLKFMFPYADKNV